MAGTSVALVFAGIAAVLILQIVILLRTKTSTNDALVARLTQVEQGLQSTLQASGKTELAASRVESRFEVVNQSIAAGFEDGRRKLQDQFTQSLEEGRRGRVEIATFLSEFQSKLDQRLGGFEGAVHERLGAIQKTSNESMELVRKSIDEKLSQSLSDSREGRIELHEAFRAFEAKLEQRLIGFDASLIGRFDALQGSLSARQGEANEALKKFGVEMRDALVALTDGTRNARETLLESSNVLQLRVNERFDALSTASKGTLDSLKSDIAGQLSVMSLALKNQLQDNGNQLRNQFSSLQDAVTQQMGAISKASTSTSDQLRATLNERLGAIQADNTAKLEEMRRTVDEKLHATLEQRLGDSFRIVSERLELVHAGLGEMKNLAGSVGDLKKVMSNVRARGVWGEVQLGSIIESILTVDQYRQNVKTVPGSNDIVEFAVRMPGKEVDVPVWIPIDSKYPIEHYQRLTEAHETLDKDAVKQALTAFESSIRAEAKKISTKYISPPHTTDFAILFVPTEGLFAEVMRVPGLVEGLQNDFRVVVAGPTTLGAMLNSLRLGFRTLAIEKRSSEVWGILGSVKTEFQKFGEVVESTKKSIDAAANKFTELGRRTRAIQRNLRDVQELPAPIVTRPPEVQPAIPLQSEDPDDDDEVRATN